MSRGDGGVGDHRNATPQALTLPKTLAHELEREGGAQWTTLAARLSARLGRAMSPGALAAIAALQRALLAVLSAYDAGAPGRLQGLGVALAQADPESAAALTSVSARWTGPPGVSDAMALFMLAALARNPALADSDDLLDLGPLRGDGKLGGVAEALAQREAATSPPAGFETSLRATLDAPLVASTDSIEAQLRWAMSAWRPWLMDASESALLDAVDILAEENRPRGAGPGPAAIPSFEGLCPASPSGDPGREAQLSQDTPWMPNLVLIAKMTFVWLHQLSVQHGRPIQRLDDIPDAALSTLAARGITGLWLVGLWQRSPASQAIKRRRGNPEAEASAYALYDYQIAPRLGGDEALSRLRDRAAAHGIRLAADMVPNHFGLDSRWLAEHPERFLQLSAPPYPGYGFEGPNLSGDERIEVYLEDGYWNETDAAVVFKHVHRATGAVRYIYHGNDGTQMPWNDTAQLDYLQPTVREAVISTIIDVARRFPIIRFDAAMTLATRHIERLWHPPPGEGGAIPSRSVHGVDARRFVALLPREFWHDVVARVQDEVPDTLLLAEAFWMMEGYFVGVLGMHRVYNSAFMHLLRDEENERYQGLLAETLQANPALLGRYANFMSTPDETTAVAQFGTGDKYLGVATMMATLPGTPMLGHGQWEGLAEKYGMEYARPYHDEQPNAALVAAHDRWIAPLLEQRHLFSGTALFTLFEVEDATGQVNPNVFAYANGGVGGHSLVVYNNAATRAHGRMGRPVPVNTTVGTAPTMTERSLVAALGLTADADRVFGLYELRTDRWCLCTAAHLTDGLPIRLDGYGALVFTQVREFMDPAGTWRQLIATTPGGWLADPEDAHRRWVQTLSATPPAPAGREDG